jgi:hypothetical protein
MTTITPLVERALTAWPETRDSDRKLILAVWWLQDNDYEQHFRSFFLNKAIMPDTITRCRRKLQEQGKYPASKEVENARFNKFKAVREAAPVREIDYIMSVFDH